MRVERAPRSLEASHPVGRVSSRPAPSPAPTPSCVSGRRTPVHRDTGGHARGLPPLHDDVALKEIELYGEVLIAVAGTDEPLSPAELDRALGLSPEPVGPIGSLSSAPDTAPGPPPRAEPFPPRLPARIDST